MDEDDDGTINMKMCLMYENLLKLHLQQRVSINFTKLKKLRVNKYRRRNF